MKKLIFACTLSFCLSLAVNMQTHAQVQKINTPYEKGTTEKGFPVGEWSYYDNAEEAASLIIDYSKGTLVYLKADTSSFAINVNNNWQYLATERQPRFMGSMFNFYEAFSQSIEYPRDAIREGNMGIVYLYFEIDTLGKAGNVQAFYYGCSTCAEAAKTAFFHIPNYWLPARFEGKAVPASFILPVVFKIRDTKVKFSIEENLKELPLARVLPETSVEGYGVIMRSNGINNDVEVFYQPPQKKKKKSKD